MFINNSSLSPTWPQSPHISELLPPGPSLVTHPPGRCRSSSREGCRGRQHARHDNNGRNRRVDNPRRLARGTARHGLDHNNAAKPQIAASNRSGCKPAVTYRTGRPPVRNVPPSFFRRVDGARGVEVEQKDRFTTYRAFNIGRTSLENAFLVFRPISRHAKIASISRTVETGERYRNRYSVSHWLNYQRKTCMQVQIYKCSFQ